MDKDDLTTKEAAEELGLAWRTVQKWVQEGVFPNAYPINPQAKRVNYRIPRSDIESLLEKRQPATE